MSNWDLPQTNEIDCGNGLDVILQYNYMRFDANGFFEKSLSNGVQRGYIKDVEILIKESKFGIDGSIDASIIGGNYKVPEFIKNMNSIAAQQEWLFSESDHQIIFDEEANTITLGSGWSYLANSETGMGDWHTKSYVYEDVDGTCFLLETTLEVTNIASSPNERNPHRTILSGHESEIDGCLNYSFGADSGTGAKLIVIANGEEVILTPSEVNSVAGDFGTLTISKEGIFSYKAKPNIEGTDEFQFQIQDSDGNIIDTDVNGNPLNLFIEIEKPELSLTPDINMTESDEEKSISFEIPGYTIIDISMNSDIARLEQNTYKIPWGAIDHSGCENRVHTDTIHVIYQDRFGNTYEVDRNVNVHDTGVDAYIIDIDLTNAFEYSNTTDNENGKKLFYDFRMDDDPDKISITYDGYGETVAIKENTETTVRGKYGDLTFTLANGNIDFHYKMDEKAEVIDTFKFTFTDSDGSSASNEIEIKTRFAIDIYKRDMNEMGTNSIISLPAWLEGCRIIDVEIQDVAGYAYQDDDGQWHYQLDKPLDHSSDNPGIIGENNDVIKDEIIIWYRDANGKLSNMINDVFIYDSNPETVSLEVNSTNMTILIGTSADPGEDGTSLPYFYDFGADYDPEKSKLFITGADGQEQEIAFVSVMEIRGEHGLLTINVSDGHFAYMYEADEEVDHLDTFTFRIVDSDGDERTSSFQINTTFDPDYVPDAGDSSDIAPIADELPTDASVSEGEDQPDAEKPANLDAEANSENQEPEEEISGELLSEGTESDSDNPDQQPKSEADEISLADLIDDDDAMVDLAALLESAPTQEEAPAEDEDALEYLRDLLYDEVDELIEEINALGAALEETETEPDPITDSLLPAEPAPPAADFEPDFIDYVPPASESLDTMLELTVAEHTVMNG